MLAGPGGIATGAVGTGALDGSVAEAIAGIATAPGSPDEAWTTFVTRVAAASRTERDGAALAGMAATSAENRQLSTASVDMNEETLNMLTYQRGYEASARVMTAIDEMLDVLINRTGVVGR